MGQKRLRVGAVTYLNTKPLVFDFQAMCPNTDLVFDYPSRLADRLANGELDIALIPALEYFRGDDYAIVSDACIGCRGPVMSVKLLSRVPINTIRTLALDEGSRTSVALVQILLHERANVRPVTEPLPMGARIDDTEADAVLVIGDRAMHVDESKFAEVWDLGDQWCRWSELPFVFALWVTRRNADVCEMSAQLSAVRDAGLHQLKEIAAEYGPQVGLTEHQAYVYLNDYLYFYFGTREKQGLDLYYRHAVELQLVPEGRELQFHDCQTS